jgi:hypothetical protein
LESTLRKCPLFGFLLYALLNVELSGCRTRNRGQVAGGTQMKCGRLSLLLLAVASSYVCFAQSGRPAPDPTQLSVTQALREGRITDAEKLLTDAIRELEQSDPQSLRLATYLKELSGFLDRRGRHTEALALSERASEIERNAYGPSDLRLSSLRRPCALKRRAIIGRRSSF